MDIYRGGTFISCETNNRVYTAMAVDRGRIAWLGEDGAADMPRGRVRDLGGGTVTPAFGDTHMHFESFSMFERSFNISEVADFDQAKEMITRYIAKNPNEKVYMGFGCSAHTVKEGRLPTRKDLDGWTNRPLIIVKYDGHAAVGNSAIMDLLSDAVKRDSGSDIDTGWLYGNAYYIGVNECTARVNTLGVLKSLSMGAAALSRAGIGLAHTVEGVGFKNDLDVDMLRLWQRFLPQTFRIFFQTMDTKKVLRRRMTRIGGCFSLALDGCFGSEDAALTEPYANNHLNKGVLNYTQDQVNAFAIEANRLGLQIAIHAIGDAAVEQAITAFEAALEDTPREDHRHVMIHCCMASDAQLDRIARLKLCLAVQSPFISWRQEPDAYLRSILGERTDALNPLGRMLARGIMIGDGSDAPCTRPDPIRGMHLAVNHPTPSERVTPLKALMMRTYNPAYMSFDEKERGSLAVGKAADFVLLDRNPLTIAPEAIGDTRVLALYLGGKQVKA